MKKVTGNMDFLRETFHGLFSLFGLSSRGRDPKSVQPAASGLDTRGALLDLIEPACVAVNLRAVTKDGVIEELVDVLERAGKLQDRRTVLSDLFQREKVMSTGMQHGIALPHAKSEGTKSLRVAIGIKEEGIDFESIDGEPSRIFILVLSPKNVSGPHIQFLAAIGALLKDPKMRDRVLRAESGDEVVSCLREESFAERSADAAEPGGS